ncbi:MAG: NfeD family protein [Clostridia bacterium]|nr:NfeD family protein [Clostridia bacterium]
MEIWIWVLVVIAAVVVELLTTQMISIWFAGGGLIGLIACALHAPVWLQIVLAAVVTLILLLGTRPFVNRYLQKGTVATNADRVVGQTGIITEAVDNVLEQGRVKVLGSDWRAVSADGTPLAAGTNVRVERIEGVKLIVSPV